MIRSVIFDVGETITRDDRYWAACADWLDIPRHTLSALVGAVVARGDDNSEALRLIRPGIDVPTEYAAREAAGRGEQLDDSDLYPDVRPALASLQSAGSRVVIAGNQTARAARPLPELPALHLPPPPAPPPKTPDGVFFHRVLAAADVDPATTLYVGD